jgi:hypothetical protein
MALQDRSRQAWLSEISCFPPKEPILADCEGDAHLLQMKHESFLFLQPVCKEVTKFGL